MVPNTYHPTKVSTTDNTITTNSTPKNNIEFNFEESSKGKPLFIIEERTDSRYDTLFHVCESFDKMVCSRKLSDYSGKIGYLESTEPFTSDRFNSGYKLVFQNGERLILKARKGKDPIESTLYFANYSDLLESKKLQSKPLLDNLDVTISSTHIKYGTVKYLLSNGEEIGKVELDNRISFIEKNIKLAHRSEAFTHLKNLNIRYDDFEDTWWVQCNGNLNMALRPYIGIKGKNNWLRYVAMYEGGSWVFFDTFTIKSGDTKLTKKVKSYEVTRDNGSGKVWEIYDAPVDKGIKNILKSLSKNSGKIRFSGKYTSTSDITSDDKAKIESLISLNNILG